MGAHARLLQAIALVRIIESHLQEYPHARVILGGDLNSRPATGVIRFLLTGSVNADDPDWQFGDVFSWGREGEEEGDMAAGDAQPNPECRGIDASHTLKLKLGWLKPPELTHATAGFRAVLDYLVVSEGLDVSNDFEDKRLTHSIVDKFVVLPFAAYGSDHELVGAEFTLSYF
jgi:hypothetical protein